MSVVFVERERLNALEVRLSSIETRLRLLEEATPMKSTGLTEIETLELAWLRARERAERAELAWLTARDRAERARG